MKKTFLLCMLSALLTLTGNAQEIYNFQVTNDEGKQVELAQYKGKHRVAKSGFRQTVFFAEIPDLRGDAFWGDAF